MKKLKVGIPDGGAPIGQNPVLRDIFDIENKDAIETLLSTIILGEAQGVILSGCLATGSAGNFAISAGYIFVDAKVLRYPGSTGNSATQYLKIATATEESGVFADGVTRAFIDVETAVEFSTSGGGSGTQYVTLAFATAGLTLSERVGGLINDDAVIDQHLLEARVKIESGTAQLLTKVIDIGNWNMQSSPTVSVTHGLTLSKIVSWNVVVIKDDSTRKAMLQGLAGSSTVIASTFELARTTGEAFDHVDWNAPTFQRGHIYVEYEE